MPPGTEVADRITRLERSSARQILLRAGNAYLEIFQYHSPTPRPGHPDRPVCDHGLTHLCVQVDDLDAEFARLRGAGMRFHSSPQALGGGLRCVYGRDPDGNVVELHEFPAGYPAAL
jgi:catechol 2,3-dioxygenase-like lactoylglutathione lyase family enzyme